MSSDRKWSLSWKKKNVEITPKRVTFYHKAKLIECFDDTGERYVLFFYENQFLTGQRLSSEQQQSFVQQAFTNGIIFEAPHPLVTHIVKQTVSFTSYSFQQLTQKINRFTAQDATLILTFFTGIYPDDELQHWFKETFLNLRRNGKLKSAFQLSRILIDVPFMQEWAREVGGHYDYSKYAVIYDKNLEALADMEPTFAEVQCFKQKDTHLPLLQTILTKQNRQLDLLALAIWSFVKAPDETHYPHFISQLESSLTKEEIIEVLQPIAVQSPLSTLQEDLFQRLLELNQTKTALQLLVEHPFVPTTGIKDKVLTLFEESDLTEFQPDTLVALLIRLFSADPSALNRLLRKCLKYWLQIADIETIEQHIQKLEPPSSQSSAAARDGCLMR